MESYTVAKSELDSLANLLSAGRIQRLSGDRQAHELAAALLSHFGSLELMLKAPPRKWNQFPGMNRTRLELLDAVARIVEHSTGKNGLTASDSFGAFQWFEDMINFEQEVVVGAFLNSDNSLIRRQEIFRGTVNSSLAQPREILKAALAVNAAKLIVAHNHPSSSIEPSHEDLHFTVRLEWAAETIGIPLLDHIIVGGRGDFFSFADAKLLSKQSASELAGP